MEDWNDRKGKDRKEVILLEVDMSRDWMYEKEIEISEIDIEERNQETELNRTITKEEYDRAMKKVKIKSIPARYNIG